MQDAENKDKGCAKRDVDPLAEPTRTYYYDDAHGYEEYDPQREEEEDDIDEVDD